MTTTLYRLHPFFRLRWRPPYVVELPREGRRVSLDAPSLVRLLFRVTVSMSAQAIAELAASSLGLGEEAAANAVGHLVAHGVLVSDEDASSMPKGVHEWIRHGWLEALFLHLQMAPSASERPTQRDGTVPRAATQPLPAPEPLPTGTSLEQLLLRRRTHEPMQRPVMSRQDLSSILAQQRSIQAHGGERVARAVTTYCAAFRVEGLPEGLYRYDDGHHGLDELRKADLRESVQATAMGQMQTIAGCCAIAMTIAWPVLLRGADGAHMFREALLMVGQIGHRFQLMCVHLGFSTFLSSGVEPSRQSALFGAEYHEEGLSYLVAVG